MGARYRFGTICVECSWPGCWEVVRGHFWANVGFFWPGLRSMGSLIGLLRQSYAAEAPNPSLGTWRSSGHLRRSIWGVGRIRSRWQNRTVWGALRSFLRVGARARGLLRSMRSFTRRLGPGVVLGPEFDGAGPYSRSTLLARRLFWRFFPKIGILARLRPILRVGLSAGWARRAPAGRIGVFAHILAAKSVGRKIEFGARCDFASEPKSDFGRPGSRLRSERAPSGRGGASARGFGQI